jgi:hypothetical protein
MRKPYVHSNYERIEDDDYKTVDVRCVQALIESAPFIQGLIVDPCSPSGSGIVNHLQKMGFQANGLSNAFSQTEGIDWIITNPPYKKKLVDEILWYQINRFETENVFGVAALLRNNFDFAKTRYEMFNNLWYSGQVHMMFRPRWIDGAQKHSPIHNFVWHIWTASHKSCAPSVWYWRETR